MSSVGILFLIFAFCVLFIGFYMFTGHKLGIMEGRVAFQNLSKEQWKNIGKWTMISSSVLFIISFCGFIFHWE